VRILFGLRNSFGSEEFKFHTHNVLSRIHIAKPMKEIYNCKKLERKKYNKNL
jgi:hypothetical protein